MSLMKIALVGGTGDIGTGFALRLMCSHEIIIGSRKEDKARESASAIMQLEGANGNIWGTDNASAVAVADAVILCVPPEHLKSVTYDNNDHMCGAPPYYGWHPDWFYIDSMYGYDGLLKKNHVVADIHTTPSDCFGNVTGWVMHTGTGDINLGIYVASLPSGERVAFAGPA